MIVHLYMQYLFKWVILGRLLDSAFKLKKQR